MRKVSVLIVGLLIASACGGSSGKETKPESHTLTANLTTSCGIGGDDYKQRLWDMQVLIYDEKNIIIASGKTDTGHGCDANGILAVRSPELASFSVSVPKARFYRIKVGEIDGPTLSYEDMTAKNWTLELKV